MKSIFFSLLGSLLIITAIAQPGSPDLSFGDQGIVKSPTGPVDGNGASQLVKESFIDINGNIFLVLANSGYATITKRLPGGSPDLQYGHAGFSQAVTLNVNCAAIQPDGKIVVGGTNSRSNKFVITRFNADGTIDTDFGNSGIYLLDLGSSYASVNSLVITPLNEIVAGGSADLGGTMQFVLAGFTSTGLPNTNFGNAGVVSTVFPGMSATLNSLAIQSDGKIVAAGYANDVSGEYFALAKYLPNGAADPGFNAIGYLTTNFTGFDYANAVAVDNNNKIFVGGNSQDAGGYMHFRIASYNSDGTPDLNYNQGTGSILVSFGNSNDELRRLKLQNDGSVIAAGTSNFSQVSTDVEIVHVLTDGTLDTQFGNNGQVLSDYNSGYDYCEFLLIQPNEKIISGGGNYSFQPDFQFRFTAYRFDSFGQKDGSFGNGGTVADFFANSFTNYFGVFSDNLLNPTVSGEIFDGHTNHQNLSRFTSAGVPDNTFGINGIVGLDPGRGDLLTFQPDGKLIKALSTPAAELSLTRYNYDGTPDNSFGTSGTVIQAFPGQVFANSIAFQSDGKLVVGMTSYSINGGSDIIVARLNADGSADNSFGTNGFVIKDYTTYDYVTSIALAPNGNILAGEYSLEIAPDYSSFTYSGRIIRFTPDGNFDQSFGNAGTVTLSDANSLLNKLIVQSNSKIVYNYFIYDNNLFPGFLQRLNEDGTVDVSFGTNGKTSVESSSLTAQPDDKMLMTSQVVDNTSVSLIITRYDKDGIVDPTFGTNGKTILKPGDLSSYAANLLVYKDKAIFVPGQCLDNWGIYRGFVAKLLLESSPAISCPSDTALHTDLHQCSALVNNINPVTLCTGSNIMYSLSGATTGSGSCTASGLTFNEGVTNVTYTLNGTSSCSFKVSVSDVEIPVVSNLCTSVTNLWPANNKMQDITLNYTTTDNCGIASAMVTVSSNEPVSVNNCDPAPDWEIIDNHHIRLRAQRLEQGNGRVYTITITTTDVNGNTGSAKTNVYVPRKQAPLCRLEIKATPNPSNSYFSISVNSSNDGKPATTNTDKIDIRIFNSSGKIMSTYNNLSSPALIRVGDKYIPGVYYLEATQAGTIQSIKLVKI